MAYDIHIAIGADEISTDAVSLDSRQHRSIMRYVYQSNSPIMYRFIDYYKDAEVAHSELDELENEIKSIGLEMRKESSDQRLLQELVTLINTAKSIQKGLRSLCD